MPSAGTPIRRIRMDDDLWERLDKAVKRADPDDSRPALIRPLAHWYAGDIDEMPNARAEGTRHRQAMNA